MIGLFCASAGDYRTDIGCVLSALGVVLCLGTVLIISSHCTLAFRICSAVTELDNSQLSGISCEKKRGTSRRKSTSPPKKGAR